MKMPANQAHQQHRRPNSAGGHKLPFSIEHILGSPIKQSAAQQQQAAALMLMGQQQPIGLAAEQLGEQLALLAGHRAKTRPLPAGPSGPSGGPAWLSQAGQAQLQFQPHQPHQQIQQQQQLHHFQQQQLMAAAAIQQQQQASLWPLNQVAGHVNSPNFLSYFMAYMLLQQQQQQQTLPVAPNSLVEQELLLSQANQIAQQQQLEQQHPTSQKPAAKLIDSAAKAIGPKGRGNQEQRQPSLKQSLAQPKPQPIENHIQSQNQNISSHSGGSQDQTSKWFPVKQPIQSSNQRQKIRRPSEPAEQSTALSSLANFVSESLAPILEAENSAVRPARPALSSPGSSRSSAGSSSTRLATAVEPASPSPIGRQEQAGKTSSALELTNSAAKTLKANNASISSSLSKAPPELVQKQPAWVFCTRYSDRPSSGPRTRRTKTKDKRSKETKASSDEKRPRTAFTNDQLEQLREEFRANSYLDERRRKDLADRLCLNENQIKIWFQNKRAKNKKLNNQPNPLRGLLVAGGLYNHSTATSDCSESYANGNDHEIEDENGDEEEDEDEDQRHQSKRARLSQASEFESGSESSQVAGHLEEDERVISVS